MDSRTSRTRVIYFESFRGWALLLNVLPVDWWLARTKKSWRKMGHISRFFKASRGWSSFENWILFALGDWKVRWLWLSLVFGLEDHKNTTLHTERQVWSSYFWSDCCFIAHKSRWCPSASCSGYDLLYQSIFRVMSENGACKFEATT